MKRSLTNWNRCSPLAESRRKQEDVATAGSAGAGVATAAAEHSWVCGLDLGMMTDPTALAILQVKNVCTDGRRRRYYAALHLQRWLGVDYPTIAEQLLPILGSLSPAAVMAADETGVGVGVLQILRRARLPLAQLRGITITGGQRARLREDGGFSVPKKELVSATQSALQSKRLAVSPKIEHARILQQELRNFKVKVNAATGHESYEAWREGQHDDLVLAVCMAVWLCEHGRCDLRASSFHV